MNDAIYDHIIIIRKKNHQGAHVLAEKIATWLEEKAYTTQICEVDGLRAIKHVSKKTLAIVLGGDGTMISAGRSLVDLSIPIFGINFGKVGFLTNVMPKQWEEGLTQCLQGELPRQPRLILNWRQVHANHEETVGYAVNDVVISHGALARLIGVDITINNESMGALRCDGIILATPVGSSGYTASAGGPILYANTDAFIFTPICPFLKSVSPMVFPPSCVFKISIVPGTTDCYLTVDGQEAYTLLPNDYLEITAKADGVIFLGREELFLERIRSRGLVLEEIYNGPCVINKKQNVDAIKK